MLRDFYATKLTMSQVWDQSGKRIPVTVLSAPDMLVVDKKELNNKVVFEIGVGKKKIKNAKKPLKAKLKKSGFSFAPLKIKGNALTTDDVQLEVGQTVKLSDILTVGDVVDVQGVSKGRGFAGGMKRHGFKGGPKTHGQSDRARAVGSIGAGTTPGRVLKGKRMPGHYGVETKTVKGLVVLAINEDNNQLLLSGPVPGHIQSLVRIRKTNKQREVKLTEASLAAINMVPKTKEEAKANNNQPQSDESSETNKAKVETQINKPQVKATETKK